MSIVEEILESFDVTNEKIIKMAKRYVNRHVSKSTNTESNIYDAIVDFMDIITSSDCDNDDYIAEEKTISQLNDAIEIINGFSNQEEEHIENVDNYVDEPHPIHNSLKSVPQYKQRTDEWFEQRKHFFTASMIHTIIRDDIEFTQISKRCPIVKYKKPYDSRKGTLYNKYTGNRKVIIDRSAINWGTKYEEIITQIYSLECNTVVTEYGLIPHKDKRLYFLGASPDGITREGRILEIKSPFSRKITGEIMLPYWYQVQMQYACIQSQCSVPLAGIDFVEGSLCEYTTENDFLFDAIDNECGENEMPHQFTRDGTHKGVIGRLQSKTEPDGDPLHVYPPLTLTYSEKKVWIDNESKKLENTHIFKEYIMWGLNTPLSIVDIEPHKEWFENYPANTLKHYWQFMEKLKLYPKAEKEFIRTKGDKRKAEKLMYDTVVQTNIPTIVKNNKTNKNPIVSEDLDDDGLTRVVRLKRTKGKIVQDCDVYIGRRLCMGGWKLKKSKWHNPFTVKDSGSAERAVELYREYVKSNKELMADIHELQGKTLGCWCKPGICHGDVLAELADEEIVNSSSSRSINNNEESNKIEYIWLDD